MNGISRPVRQQWVIGPSLACLTELVRFRKSSSTSFLSELLSPTCPPRRLWSNFTKPTDCWMDAYHHRLTIVNKYMVIIRLRHFVRDRPHVMRNDNHFWFNPYFGWRVKARWTYCQGCLSGKLARPP
ncbi:hypothetical protein PGT21_006097 [Puccinia graminis f. sp. tritici]|uniref:Uncharacterized protein n=1 Tax=Puccinia graminis f. sp. tritici TaxID=56615 RepID=A0A5B0PTC2_PUCGR|nr:hypothetical protein PGTUg99_025738 [Puccinia graminis f. sp. tritici]KAA1103963.1 hypothetical protein PGT21_006097 [Puccinia graminis f. sp. tritici]